MIQTRSIAYRFGEQSFEGYFADGSQGRRVPGILVAHEGPGLTEHPKERARLLAELGYAALAMDIFGEPPPEMERARMLVRTLTRDLAALRGRAWAALTCLQEQPMVDPNRIAAIGFCFGGTTVLELARAGAPLAGVVGFHAGLTTSAPADAANIKGPVLVCMGTADPIITAEQRLAFEKEMDAGGVDWRMELYGGVGHSFTNRYVDAFSIQGFRYDARADARSWRSMRAFLDEVLATRAAS